MSPPSFSPPLNQNNKLKGEATVQSLCKINCPDFILLLTVLLSSCMLLAVELGPFRKTCLALDFWTLGARRHQSQKSERALSLVAWPLISGSSAGVCHPPLSQTDVCLPVYCSWPGRLVGVPASVLSLTLWNTTAVRLLPDSMLIVWINSPMFNQEGKGKKPEIMIIASKSFCVRSHLYIFSIRCHSEHGLFLLRE